MTSAGSSSSPDSSTINRRSFLTLFLKKGTLLWLSLVGSSGYLVFYKIKHFRPKRNAKIPSLRLESSYPLALVNHPEIIEKYPDTHTWTPGTIQNLQNTKSNSISKYANEPFAPTEHHSIIIIGGGPIGLFLASKFRSKNPLLLEQFKQLGGTSKGEIAGPFSYSYLQWRFSSAEKEMLERTANELRSSIELKWRKLSAIQNIPQNSGLLDPTRQWLFQRPQDWIWSIENGDGARFFHEYTKALIPMLPAGQIRTQTRVMEVLPYQDRVGIIYEDYRGKPVHLTGDRIILTQAEFHANQLIKQHFKELPDSQAFSANCMHFAFAEKINIPTENIKNEPQSYHFNSGTLGPCFLQTTVSPTGDRLIQGITSTASLDIKQAREKVIELIREASDVTQNFNPPQSPQSPHFLRIGLYEGLPFPRRDKPMNAAQPVPGSSERVWMASRSLHSDSTLIGAFQMAESAIARVG